MLEEDLTYREKLYLYRWRRHLRPTAHAKLLGMSFEEYRRLTDSPPQIDLRGLDANEIFVVRRFRAKLSRKALAERMGCNVRFVDMMERGERSNVRLREYWGV